jgi:hypothetical protein
LIDIAAKTSAGIMARPAAAATARKKRLTRIGGLRNANIVGSPHARHFMADSSIPGLH